MGDEWSHPLTGKHYIRVTTFEGESMYFSHLGNDTYNIYRGTRLYSLEKANHVCEHMKDFYKSMEILSEEESTMLYIISS